MKYPLLAVALFSLMFGYKSTPHDSIYSLIAVMCFCAVHIGDRIDSQIKNLKK